MAENIIDGSGIQIETYPEIVNDIINGTQQVPGLVRIYGPDINVGSNTPDGNLINIFALSKEDILQLCVAIYDSFDPDQAVGVALDAISQLCGISRQGGSYTQTNVVLVATQAVNLVGLDNPAATPFTISDANNNQFQLVNSQTISAAGTYTYLFQSANIGFTQVIPNTITNIVTITPGVATVNNPSVPTLVGQDQETDAAMRIRRQQSISIPSQGSLNGLIGGLQSIYGVDQAVVYENNTGTTNAYGVPPYSIWCIVNGGSSQAIGNMIYDYWFPGVGMKGSQLVPVTNIDGSSINIYYDKAVYENFYSQFNVHSKSNSGVNTTAIASYLSDNYVLNIYQAADITAMASLLMVYSSDLVMSSAGVSLTNSNFTSEVFPSAYLNKLVLPAANITISVI